MNIGDSVRLSDQVRHPAFRGMCGIVERIVKSRGVVVVRFPDGRRYDALPENCGPTLIDLAPVATDQKTVAERKWQAGLKPGKPQLPADHGLFSDDHLQLDLVEMLQDPTNEE